jgi:hypothetical protein
MLNFKFNYAVPDPDLHCQSTDFFIFFYFSGDNYERLSNCNPVMCRLVILAKTILLLLMCSLCLSLEQATFAYQHTTSFKYGAFC